MLSERTPRRRARGRCVAAAALLLVGSMLPAAARADHQDGAAEQASREVLSLPIFPELSAEQRDHVVASIRRFFGASAAA